jgi:V/A-type H+-transporting ATPase subunit I
LQEAFVFKPETLVRITIQVPAESVSTVTAALARFRLLHLIRIRETHLGRLGYVAETDGDLLRTFEDFFKESKGLLDGLRVRPEPVTLGEPPIPEKEVFRIQERLSEAKEKVGPFVNELTLTARKLVEKRALYDKFALLPADIEFSRLSGCRFLNWMVGLVPAQAMEKLEESLSEIPYAFVHVGTLGQRAIIVVFGLKEDWPVFERALRGAFFERIDIPAEVSGTAGGIIEKIHIELAELEGKKSTLSRQREDLEKTFGKELLLLKEKIITCRSILLARRFFGKIEKSYLISGWIPERLFEVLKEALTKAARGQLIFERVDPEEQREVRGGIVRIPVLFNNPLLVSPFQRLTSLYGTPRYKEVEPTILFALGFLLMFGMMFGDVGQGAVLFLVGHLIFRRFYKYMDYGIIIMECGLVSVLFGFLYGSLFGLENVIPALWFRPLDDISYLVKVAVILGIVMVSLGLVLNVINAFRLKEYEGLLTAGGLAGALLYWGFVGLGAKYFLTGRLLRNEVSVFGWVAAVLMTIIVLHRPLYLLLAREERLGALISRKGVLAEVMESIVEFLDNIIRYLANTISFIRVAAFALAHAALFIAVFSVADLVAHENGGGVFYWVVLTAGNVVIIVLEGLVVSIQVIRLEYYEFFSKFFRGGGEAFRPFDREIGLDERKNQ